MKDIFVAHRDSCAQQMAEDQNPRVLGQKRQQAGCTQMIRCCFAPHVSGPCKLLDLYRILLRGRKAPIMIDTSFVSPCQVGVSAKFSFMEAVKKGNSSYAQVLRAIQNS